jgi:hypothetical protein
MASSGWIQALKGQALESLEVLCRTVNAAPCNQDAAEGLALLALRCHRLRLHRLLKWPLLQPPGILSAFELVPALGLRNPFAPVPRLQPGPLEAVRFHFRAIIAAHRRILLSAVYFFPLRQSHYDYVAERFLKSVPKNAASDPDEFPSHVFCPPGSD